MTPERIVDEIVASGYKMSMPFASKMVVTVHRKTQEVIVYVPEWAGVAQYDVDHVGLDVSERLGTVIMIKTTEAR